MVALEPSRGASNAVGPKPRRFSLFRGGSSGGHGRSSASPCHALRTARHVTRAGAGRRSWGSRPGGPHVGRRRPCWAITLLRWAGLHGPHVEVLDGGGIVGSDVGSSGGGGAIVTSVGGHAGQVTRNSPLSGRLDTIQPSGNRRYISGCGRSFVRATLPSPCLFTVEARLPLHYRVILSNTSPKYVGYSSRRLDTASLRVRRARLTLALESAGPIAPPIAIAMTRSAKPIS